MKRFLLLFAFSLIISVPLMAEIIEKTIEYDVDNSLHEGFFFFKEGETGKKPGVIVVHEWKGIGDHVLEIGRKLAEEGYVAFVADIYGKGIRPTDNKEAAKLSGSYKGDRPKLRGKVLAALEQLKKHELVDEKKIAAIGYCFGGTTVLELARSGAEVAGVVSFHGGLASPKPEDAKNIKAAVLVLHGGIDPHVPDAEMIDFMKEMRDAAVDWQLFSYGKAVHSFTNKAAGNDPSQGVAYHELTDRRAWQAMKIFFAEIFQN
ncbi:MAG: dienelactone hydrolase family protein [Candidatus Rifleibacteriota bacterium]